MQNGRAGKINNRPEIWDYLGFSGMLHTAAAAHFAAFVQNRATATS